MIDPYTRKADVRVGDVCQPKRGKPFRVLEMNGARTWCLVGWLDGTHRREVETKYVEKCHLVRRKK